MSQLFAVDAITGARERIGDLLRDGPRRVSYQILDVLGYGTYGCIYLAKTVGPALVEPEYHAIKCLSKRGLTPTQLLLQRQEIDLHLSLSSAKDGQHPHIVNMSSLIETKDSLYLVMEYCSGGDLYDAITSQHAAARDSGVDFTPMVPLSSRCLNVHSDSSVLDAMSQIVSALAHSHSRQVFHRDLKPENILIAGDGSLKLADFGLATKDRISTDYGCGSSFYMAPEQQPATTSGRRPYLPSKSDVWSLGIIFLNLRFGRNPWKLSRVDVDMTFAAYAANPDILCQMFPDLSSSALFFLQRVLCVDPNDRADCYEALELIHRIDTILMDNVDSSHLATMELTTPGRLSSDSTLADSFAGSSRSSVDSERASSCSEEEESIFQMEDDYGATHRRSGSRASSWSMASSHHSGKSWSDMVEEEEMDFSLPVEFEEMPSTEPLSSQESKRQTDMATATSVITTTLPDQNDLTHQQPLHTADDLDDDFLHFSLSTSCLFSTECHDLSTTTDHHHHYNSNMNNHQLRNPPKELSSPDTGPFDDLGLSWSLSSSTLRQTWLDPDLTSQFRNCSFTKLSDLMLSKSGDDYFLLQENAFLSIPP